MTLKEFISQYNKRSAVILLEGKRDVQEKDKDRLIALGKLLATRMIHVTFRSGNAEGAGYYFSLGVAVVDKSRLQVITPYADHRKKLNQAYDTISLENINIAEEPDVIYQSKKIKRLRI